MEGSALLCRFTPYTDAANNEVHLPIDQWVVPCSPMHPSLRPAASQPATSAPQVGLAEQEAGSWLVGAAVVANNIVSCAANANSLARTSSEGVIPSVGAKGWHRVTVLTTYMHELGVRVPYENGESFLCCPAMYMLRLHLLCLLYVLRLHLLCLSTDNGCILTRRELPLLPGARLPRCAAHARRLHGHSHGRGPQAATTGGRGHADAIRRLPHAHFPGAERPPCVPRR